MSGGNSLKIGYWNVRGIMQPIRMLLEYTGTNYTEKLYEVKKNPDGSRDRTSWTNERTSLGLEFPNLPYMIDEESKITLTQSRAILRYIAAKHQPSLLGTGPAEMSRVEMLMGVALDFYCEMAMTAYTETEEVYKEARVNLEEKAKEFLARMGSYIKGRRFCMGDDLTVADFVMYETLDLGRKQLPQYFCGTSAEWVQTYLATFASQPRIASYMKSPKCIKGPFTCSPTQYAV